MKRNRRDIVAAALDRVVSDRIGGPFFEFHPGPYGPFDGAVCDVIGEMAAAGDAVIDESDRYLLAEAGRAKGEAVLASFEPPVADYFGRAARWARLMPHLRMLAAIRTAYPEMAGNGGVRDRDEERSIRRWHPFVRGMAGAFDLTGSMFQSADQRVGPASDADAIRDIWRDVGESLEDAMVGFGETERLW